MSDTPDDIMMKARFAYVSVLPASSQWMAGSVLDGLADASLEVQAAARAIMAERERCRNETLRYASFYPPSSDGKATLTMLADFIESGRKGEPT